MAHPEDLLELRLDHAATPERVASATRLLADVLSPMLADEDTAPEPGLTVVVSNRALRATVRVLDPALLPKVEVLAAFLEDPRETLEISPQVARALIRYAREEARFRPTFWRAGKSPRVLRVLDEKFADVVERSLLRPPARRPRVVGATFLCSKIYKIGRRDDASPTRARVLLADGTMKELVVADSAHAAVSAAYDSGREQRIKLVGDWVHRKDGLELEYGSSLRIVGVDEQLSRGTAAGLLAAVTGQPALRKHELAGVLRQLRGGDDDDP